MTPKLKPPKDFPKTYLRWWRLVSEGLVKYGLEYDRYVKFRALRDDDPWDNAATLRLKYRGKPVYMRVWWDCHVDTMKVLPLSESTFHTARRRVRVCLQPDLRCTLVAQCIWIRDSKDRFTECNRFADWALGMFQAER